MQSAGAARQEGDLRRAFRTVLVADVVEFVRLVELDEDATIRRWKLFTDHLIGELLPRHRGVLVKSTGDGAVVIFDDVSGGVECSFAMHRRMQQDNVQLPDALRMCLRIGVDCGEVVLDALDVQGRTVNLAARLMTLAGPANTVASAAVRDLLVEGIDADVLDLGECHLKHLERPVRAYRLSEAGQSEAPAHQGVWITPAQLTPVVAVIPFAHVSGDERLTVVSEMIADEVINDLSRSIHLQVISRLSASQVAQRPNLLDNARQHLRANYLVHGSCQLGAADMLRLHVELVDVGNERVLWAETFNLALRDALGQDADLAHRLAREVALIVLQHELEQARVLPLPNLNAYSMMLGGLMMLHRFSRHDFERSKVILEALVERVPRHPTPIAWLARWYDLRAFQGWSDRPDQDRQTALGLCARALDIDDGSSIALTVAGAIHGAQSKDLDKSMSLLRQAINSNPNEPLAWLLLGAMHSFKGEGAAAIEATEQAMRLSPTDPMRFFYDALGASACLAAEQYERAIELATRSLRVNRMHLSTYRVLAIAQALNGREDQARQTVADLLTLDPSFCVSEFPRRSPGAEYEIGKRFAAALRSAGLPETATESLVRS